MGDWKLVSFWGSLRDGDPYSADAAFHAGHVNDVLRLNTAPFFPVLVASDTSGVWIVNEFGGIAIPLSWDWSLPHLNCLSPGIYSDQHVYAGGDALWETDTTTSVPLLNWRQIPIQTDGEHPLNPGQIYRVIVVRERSKVVLASDGGIFWANIPAAPGTNYSFRRASLLPGLRYSGLAEGLKNTVVAGAWGSDLNSHFGIFVGDWTGASGDLIFSRASILGSINARMMLRTEISSCAGDHSRLYAVCGGGGGLTPVLDKAGKPQTDGFGDVVWNGDDLIYRVLASTDGGNSWNVTGSAIPGSADQLFNGPKDVIGHTQGGYNLCIAVSPFDPNLVAVGVGTYALSKKAGNDDWEVFGGSPHLHADIHGLYFDQTDPARLRLYVCSDGGLASTPDLGKTYATGANRQLPNFQFRRFAASPLNSGLVGGSLQDNGDVYTMQYVNVDPWKDLDGGDGVLMMFLQSGHLVRSNNTLTLNVSGTDIEYGNKTRIAAWDDGKRAFNDLKLFPTDPLSRGVIPVDSTGDGLNFSVVEVVDEPAWINAAGQSMLGVGEVNETMYGLFNDGTGRFVWNQLATVPHEPDKDPTGKELPYFAMSIASFDGNAILVGMNNGKVFRFDAPAWTAIELTIPGNSNGVIRFAAVGASPIFAIAGSRIFRYSGTTWANVTPTAPAPTPTSSLTAVTTDRGSPRTIYLASSAQLWNSNDDGATWFDATGTLPRAAQIQDLRYVTETSGASFLYLSTFGWSAFRRLLNFDEVLKTVTVSGHMDIVDRVAFGHDDWAHPAIFNILQLGPLHPFEEADYTETDGDEVKVELNLRFEWHTDFSVVVKYDASLIAMDEDNYVDDHQAGSLTVPFGTTGHQIIDLASDEYWPDRAHIEVNIANP